MTFPLLPDKSFKLLVYLGIGLIIYAWISRFTQAEKYEQKRIEYNVEIRKLKNETKYLDQELSSINEKAEFLAGRFSKDNPLTISDSGYTFTRTIRGDKISLTLSDSISSLLKSYNSKNDEIAKKNDELDIKEYEVKNLYNSFNEIDNFALGLTILGLLLSIVGVSVWASSENLQVEILKRKNLHLPKYSEKCQSCGFIFNSLTKYSTEDTNGNINYHFCSNCYANGKFIINNLTLEEMKESLREQLGSKGKSEKYIVKSLKKLSNLDRWK